MDKPREFLASEKAETMLEWAVKQQLKRLDLKRAVCSSHRTAGTAPVPGTPAAVTQSAR